MLRIDKDDRLNKDNFSSANYRVIDGHKRENFHLRLAIVKLCIFVLIIQSSQGIYYIILRYLIS